MSLDWRAIQGVMENSPAATIIDFSSGKPIATRPTASKVNGELASMGNKYQMNKREIRELLELQDNIGKFGISASDLVDFLFPDLKRATTGPHKTIDRLFLEAISTGKMTLTNVVNPKGVVWNSALNWGITTHKTSGAVWTTAGTATPLADIRGIVEEWSDKGVEFKLMKMSRKTFNLMIATTEFKKCVYLRNGVRKQKDYCIKESIFKR